MYYNDHLIIYIKLKACRNFQFQYLLENLLEEK